MILCKANKRKCKESRALLTHCTGIWHVAMSRQLNPTNPIKVAIS